MKCTQFVGREQEAHNLGYNLKSATIIYYKAKLHANTDNATAKGRAGAQTFSP
jgi:hypothetical protein